METSVTKEQDLVLSAAFCIENGGDAKDFANRLARYFGLEEADYDDHDRWAFPWYDPEEDE